MSDKHSLGVVYYDITSGGYNMAFKFEFIEQTNGTIHIYILKQPDYASGQATDDHSTHRHGLGSNRPHICYAPKPTDISNAIKIAEGWAQRTAYYIKHKEWLNA